MKYELMKNVVMCQGHSAVGLVQFGGTIFVWGDNGEKGNTGPNFELVLFRPYSKQWFYCRSRRGLTRRAADWLVRAAKFLGLAQSANR
jgi:hypothetical protein